MKHNQSSTESEDHKHKQFDRQVKDMVTAITHRVADLHKSPGSSQHNGGVEEDDHGIGIITLAGTNTGATMRSELDEKSSARPGEPEDLNTYVNSNFQAVNNSIMMGSHYNTNDPGVHMEVSDVLDHHDHHKPDRHKKKEKKKEKDSSKSDHHYSDHSY